MMGSSSYSKAGTAAEAAFQAEVEEWAVMNGWFVWATRRSDKARVNPGWPDLAIARDGEFILAELKTQVGRVSPIQHAALAVLGTSVEVHLWRPSDWPEIEQRLRRENGRKYPLSGALHRQVDMHKQPPRVRARLRRALAGASVNDPDN